MAHHAYQVMGRQCAVAQMTLPPDCYTLCEEVHSLYACSEGLLAFSCLVDRACSGSKTSHRPGIVRCGLHIFLSYPTSLFLVGILYTHKTVCCLHAISALKLSYWSQGHPVLCADQGGQKHGACASAGSGFFP